jgi:hypothetical protein
LLPDAEKRRGEVLRLLANPLVKVFGRKPRAGFDFLGMKLKRAFVLAAIDPDEFLAGLFAGIDPQDARGRAGQMHAEFLVHFAERAGIVILAAINVARSGGIPHAGKVVFLVRTLLQEEFATGIENQNMDGAMFEALPVNFGARQLADNLVPIIYDIENLVLHDSSYRAGAPQSIAKPLYTGDSAV